MRIAEQDRGTRIDAKVSGALLLRDLFVRAGIGLSWLVGMLPSRFSLKALVFQVIYEKCMSTLATFTAASVEMYHKVGQLLLVPNALSVKSADSGDSMAVRSLIK